MYSEGGNQDAHLGRVRRSGFGFAHVAADVWPVLQVHTDFNDVEAHGNDVLGARAVVARSRVALQCVAQVTTVQVVIA